MKLNKLLAIAATASSIALTGCGGGYGPVMMGEHHASAAPEEVAMPETKLIASTYHFGFDNSSLTDESKQELNDYAKFLAENKDTKIRIEGYTDAKGKPQYNIALGMRRAEAIANYLEEKGVERKNIVVYSYGSERPVELAQAAVYY